MKCERLLSRSIEISWTEFALEEEKGKKLLSIFPGERERERYEWRRKERSLGRLKKKDRERASEEETDVGKSQKKTSQNVADGSMLHLMGIPISPLTQGERRRYVYI